MHWEDKNVRVKIIFDIQRSSDSVPNITTYLQKFVCTYKQKAYGFTEDIYTHIYTFTWIEPYTEDTQYICIYTLDTLGQDTCRISTIDEGRA